MKKVRINKKKIKTWTENHGKKLEKKLSKEAINDTEPIVCLNSTRPEPYPKYPNPGKTTDKSKETHRCEIEYGDNNLELSNDPRFSGMISIDELEDIANKERFEIRLERIFKDIRALIADVTKKV